MINFCFAWKLIGSRSLACTHDSFTGSRTTPFVHARIIIINNKYSRNDIITSMPAHIRNQYCNRSNEWTAFFDNKLHCSLTIYIFCIFAFILLYFPRYTAPQCQQLCHFFTSAMFSFLLLLFLLLLPHSHIARTHNNVHSISSTKIKQKHFIRTARSGQTHYILYVSAMAI